MSSNYRASGGTIRYRRFAYLHKRDGDRFGLLEAVDYQDARGHLGSGFRIRQVWLTRDESILQAYDRDRRWHIVSSVFGLDDHATKHVARK